MNMELLFIISLQLYPVGGITRSFSYHQGTNSAPLRRTFVIYISLYSRAILRSCFIYECQRVLCQYPYMWAQKICLLSYMYLTVTFLCHHQSSQRNSWSFWIEISQILELSCIVNFNRSLFHIGILNPEYDQVGMRDVLGHLKMFLSIKQNFEFF